MSLEPYQQPREFEVRLEMTILCRAAPVDAHVTDDPDIEEVKEQIIEHAAASLARDLSFGHGDIEIEELDEIAADFLKVIKASE